MPRKEAANPECRARRGGKPGVPRKEAANPECRARGENQECRKGRAKERANPVYRARRKVEFLST